jgi:amino acid transporter
MKESRNASNAMVIVKLAIILLVIAVGIFYVDTANWNPFTPNGVGGILKGVSAVFFAYIGFDAISTTAEECENPQRDLPRGMMWAIVICTVLYILIALILTGMVNYKDLDVGDPLAFVFEKLNLKWLSGIIAVSAVVAMASVLLVFQMGQPRIWMSMSRDGLLPKRFAKIHPKYKTPSFSTIVVGFVVAVPALFMNLTIVTDLCSIGTLFAFVLVCGGVLMLQNKKDIIRGKFKTPYINAKFIFPIMLIVTTVCIFSFAKKDAISYIANEKRLINHNEFLSSLSVKQLDELKKEVIATDSINFMKKESDLERYLSNVPEKVLIQKMDYAKFTENEKYISGFELFAEKIPFWIFILITLTLAVLAFLNNLSLIPILGLISCLYMMSQLDLMNWVYFTAWLLIGLVIYFGYSAKHSKLNQSKPQST